jgi:cytochrome c biogenesis protein CcdA/glutaredoxin
MINKNLRRFLMTVTFFLMLITPFSSILGQEETLLTDEINIYFFWGEGCPHCEKEKVFLEKLEDKYPEVKVRELEVWGNPDNLKLMKDFAKELDVDVRGVPFTVVGEHYVIGWLSEEYTGKQLEEHVECALADGCQDVGAKLIAQGEVDEEVKGETVEESKEQEKKKEVVGIPEKMDLPIVGEIETKDFSLPVLTVVLGVLDGFNPCAMWVLVFLISLLLGLKDRKRMWILGIVFIITSAFVYFLFMAAWLNFILFIGMVTWVRVIIGLVALIGGGYNLREYIVNKDANCKVTNTEKRQKTFAKLKAITHKKNFWLAIGGIILLAFAVNLVEAVCSAGLPAVYTQILSLNDLSTIEYYLYILLYIFFFMLDDLIVFFVAMTTLRMTGADKKYARWSNLIGGVLMLIIGLILIFKPELLMFG